MIYRMYVIYDKVAQTYGAPFVSLNDATATRQFTHTIVQNLMAEPTDFQLYCCGVFSISTGTIEAFTQLEFIRNGEVLADVTQKK